MENTCLGPTVGARASDYRGACRRTMAHDAPGENSRAWRGSQNIEGSSMSGSTKFHRKSGQNDGQDEEIPAAPEPRVSMPCPSDTIPLWSTVNNDSIASRACTKVEGTSKEVVRTRIAPAGPHPYLDRFASGMHRPLEDDSSWRRASIQPVPIPDLAHTGIRTKFSRGQGESFTPGGTMTEALRSGIHDAVRNLPRHSVGENRDMKARDYERAVRKHRQRGGRGSIIDVHMWDLESGSPPGSPGQGRGQDAVQRGRSRGSSLARLSSPTSAASPWYDLGGNGEGPRKVKTPSGCQAVLYREMSRAKQAAASVFDKGLETAGEQKNGQLGISSEHRCAQEANGREFCGQQRPRYRDPECLGTRPEPGFPAGEGCEGRIVSDAPCEQGEAQRMRSGPRGRRGSPLPERTRDTWPSSTSRGGTRRPSRPKTFPAARPRKPFSSDSLCACLLDMAYGNTRDLSRTKTPEHDWNLEHLPAEIASKVTGTPPPREGRNGDQAWPVDGEHVGDGEGLNGSHGEVSGKAAPGQDEAPSRLNSRNSSKSGAGLSCRRRIMSDIDLHAGGRIWGGCAGNDPGVRQRMSRNPMELVVP